MLSAARRHLRDAQHLLAAGASRSPDQSWHLAGFGPECARKACLSERWADQVLGHASWPEVEPLLEWAIAMDAHAWRYDLAGWVARYPVLGRWRPEHRYERTGTRTESEAEALVAAGLDRYDAVVAALWLDGSLRELVQ